MVLRCASAVMVRPGFRWARTVRAFERVKHGETLATDDFGALKVCVPGVDGRVAV